METFLGILIPFLGTTLGAACVFFMKRSLSAHRHEKDSRFSRLSFVDDILFCRIRFELSIFLLSNIFR